MKARLKHVITFLIILTPTLAGWAHADNKITWMRLDFPPSFVVSGPEQNLGYSDVAMQIAIRELTDYSHESVFVNPPKAIQNFREQQTYCGSGLNRNQEREAFMVFSEPFVKRIPNELVIRKEELARFKPFLAANGQIDFLRLINDESLRMGYHVERSYGASIDKIINEKKREHLIHRPASDLTAGFLKMLEARRIDYIIESPDSLRYFQKREDHKDMFLSLPIKDNDALLPVYLACSKNDFGKQVIARVNTVVSRQKKAFEAGYLYWLSEDARERWAQDKR
jgi:uncharacterized protein (TIGR02285 family)